MLAHRQQLRGKVLPVVDSAVHGDEALQVQLVLHVGVVEGGVEHDDGEGQDVARVCSAKTPSGLEWRGSGSAQGSPTCGLEDAGVALGVTGCKGLHHPVNLLSFSRETEAPQKLSARHKREK